MGTPVGLTSSRAAKALAQLGARLEPWRRGSVGLRARVTIFVWSAVLTFLAAALLWKRVRVLPDVHDPFRVPDFLFDDAYYYLTVAANIADKGRSTFDGITLTNGYQPLWLGLLATLARAVGTEPLRLYIAAGLFVYGILAVTLLVVAFSAARSSERACLLAGLAVMLLYSQENVFLRGMETTLFVPLCVPLVLAIEDIDDDRGLRRLAWLLPVAILARLDAAAILPALAVVLAAERATFRRGQRPLDVVRVAVPSVVVLLLYALANELVFGIPVPISGLAKAAGGPHFSNWGVYLTFCFTLRRLWPFAALLVALELGRMRQRRVWNPQTLPRFYRSVSVLCVTAGFQYIYYACNSTWPTWAWYDYAIPLAMVALVARIVLLTSQYAMTSLWPAAPVAAALVVRIVFPSTVYLRHASSVTSKEPPPADVTEFMRTAAAGDPPELSFNQVSLLMLRSFFHGDRQTLVAMGDRAGGLSYWGRPGLSVVQTEGLVLNEAYLLARREHRGSEFLAQFPLDYFITDRGFIPTVRGDDGRDVYIVADPIQARVSDEVVPSFCFPQDAIAFRLRYVDEHEISERIAFDFRKRVECGQTELAVIRAAASGLGLRRLSLPNEYVTNPALGAGEERDRARLRASERR
jgi:hypothetical protein